MSINQSQQKSYDYDEDPLCRKISKRFYGDRYLKEDKWFKLEKKYSDIEWAKRELTRIYPEYTEQIESYNPKLIESWKDFLYSILCFVVAQKFEFQKASALIEIMVHIFQESFNNRMQEQQSYQLFQNTIIRHCLFRPPESIKIFEFEEMKKIVEFVSETFYRQYSLYFYSFTPFVNVEIRTHQMFKSRFPFSDNLQEAQEVPRAAIELLNEYLIDKETGLTPEQLEEIMRGDSIHRVPAKKRQEWLRLKEERERKEKIDKVLQKELEKLQVELDQKMAVQDEEFIQQVQDIKNPPKKK